MCPEIVYLPNHSTMVAHAKDIHDRLRAKCDFCDFLPQKKMGIKGIALHRLARHNIGTPGYTYYKCQETYDGDCDFHSMSIADVVSHMMGPEHISDGARTKFQMPPPKLVDRQAEENSDKKYIVPKIPVVVFENKKYHKCLICGHLCILHVGSKLKDTHLKGISLSKHCLEKHGGKAYKCDICHKHFGDRLNVALHVKQQHGMEPEGFQLIECHYPDCKFTCKTKSDFGLHMVRHKNGYKIWQGQGRGKHTQNINEENLELETEAAAKVIGSTGTVIQCDICGFRCTNKDPQMELEIHTDIEHPKPESARVCEQCGDSFADLYSFEYHKLRTKGKCSTYHEKKKRTKWIGTVDGRHPGWNPEKCPSCKRVANAWQLEAHFRIVHMGYQQFGCNLCQKRFPSTTNVKYHIMRVHEGKGNMDGKLRSVIGTDYFEGKNLIVDYKEAEPDCYPSREMVQNAMTAALQDKVNEEPASPVRSSKPKKRKVTKVANPPTRTVKIEPTVTADNTKHHWIVRYQ